MNRLIFTLIFTLFAHIIYAQNSEKIKINQPESVTKLINKHISYNVAKNGIDGYRIQIFFDSGNHSKSRAYAKKSNFILKYPHIRAYITYQSPNYKVRVGDFRTKLDAERFKQEILEEYPSAFSIPETIELPSLDIYDEI